ncbi:hypothetical protein [Clostridium hydrogeniformans]|uniref:hypothetical protein n=1 Tax=Clostridium hydrogeniformans TaxID=349933 RepID=UPI00047FF9F8|nr:hypothetical protein [Clostridium hydrogeniformans]
MNRQQRRKMQREVNQSTKILDNFSSKQLQVIEDITNAKAEERANMKLDELSFITDMCISTLFIELFPEKDFEYIKDVENRLAHLIEEDIIKWKKLIEGKDFNMAKKLIKEIEEKVKKKAIELIEKDVKQKESIEILLTQFPNLSKAIITNVYKNTKFELKENKDAEKKFDKETEEAAEYIFEEEIENKTIEEVKVDKHSVVQVVEEPKDIKKESKGAEKVSKLKIKSMVLEGENGIYRVCPEGVELQGQELISFSNLEELEKYRGEELKKFENRIAEFREVFKMRG